jgi:hypothetical protein
MRHRTFDVGQRVWDEKSEGHLRVLGYPVASDGDLCRADGYHLDPHGTTVADVNPDCPEDDKVVSCVYEDDLDRRVVGWDEHTDDDSGFKEWLMEWSDSWGVPARTYAFPESRLEAAGDSE